MAKCYGTELILDLRNCNPDKMNRRDVGLFYDRLCLLIDMTPTVRKFDHWESTPKKDWPKESHLLGVSAVQFIVTSSITIHALWKLKNVYINIFSCKKFNVEKTKKFASEYFEGEIIQALSIERLL